MIDDKPLILAAMKRVMGNNLTTVFVRQGHYADEAAGMIINPPPDRSIDRIGELCDHGLDCSLPSCPPRPPLPIDPGHPHKQQQAREHP